MTLNLPTRLNRFLARPLGEKRNILAWHVRNLPWHLRRLWHNIPVLKSVEPGFLFLVWNDVVREAVLSGDFEKAERKFVERFLRPGMTVLDVGSYYGLYALTASAKVGKQGLVVAFEPSPPQRRRLRLHLWLNRSRNVRVEETALSSTNGEHEFFVATKGSEGFSGLRRPDIGASVRSVRANLMTLDTYLQQRSISQVDFIKVDVEGGELDFFKGAQNLLQGKMRPVILCELQNVRARAWGHTALDTATFIRNLGFSWFRPLADGSLVRVAASTDEYEGNFVAVPVERTAEVPETTNDESAAPN
jgi:FkbM family methyltransferase